MFKEQWQSFRINIFPNELHLWHALIIDESSLIMSFAIDATIHMYVYVGWMEIFQTNWVCSCFTLHLLVWDFVMAVCLKFKWFNFVFEKYFHFEFCTSYWHWKYIIKCSNKSKGISFVESYTFSFIRITKYTANGFWTQSHNNFIRNSTNMHCHERFFKKFNWKPFWVHNVIYCFDLVFTEWCPMNV